MIPFFLALAAAVALPLPALSQTSAPRTGVDLIAPDTNTGAVAASEQASTLREPKKGSGKTLRCWQHGRLLFEDSGFKGDSEVQPNAVVVQRHDGGSVTVFDQRDAVCILSRK